MGSIMMTWTSELIKQGKKKKRREMLRKRSFKADCEKVAMENGDHGQRTQMGENIGLLVCWFLFERCCLEKCITKIPFRV